MDQNSLVRTRRALHAVAELVVAGPQYARSLDIRLKVTPGGFGTVAEPDLRVDGVHLVTPTARIPLRGTCAALGAAAGVQARPLTDVYTDGVDVSPDDPIEVDPEAASMILDGFARGDAALRALAPGEEPVLWPEHFDIGISWHEVNYGVSPGDVHLPEPYAYVGPWAPKAGPFWNMAFGAAVPLSELADADAVERFFRVGAERALGDPDAAT